jgi:hypothetical protein
MRLQASLRQSFGVRSCPALLKTAPVNAALLHYIRKQLALCSPQRSFFWPRVCQASWNRPALFATIVGVDLALKLQTHLRQRNQRTHQLAVDYGIEVAPGR